MTRILVTGPTSLPRLHQILDAAVERLDLSELAVVGDDWCDWPATKWNARRYELTRYWDAAPVADIHLWFGGARYGISREIKC